MNEIKKSDKLANVCYDIRGPVLDAAKRLEDEGHRIMKLNVGSPAHFGLNAPDEIVTDVIKNLQNSEGYCESKGLYSARKAVMQEFQKKNVTGVNIDDIYLGNGVSELISLTTMALLNNDDEILIPMPDYPLWTASVNLAGGKAIHYLCDEENEWFPNIDDMRKKITDKTRAIVIINPNNPTGALYDDKTLLQIIELAREYDLLILADEIYDKIIYDGATHTPIASLCDDVFIITYGGLSKNYRLAGYRSGWMVLSGPIKHATDFIAGLNILSSMRLCANVPAQHAIQTALGGYQSIDDLVLPTGRLCVQRDLAWEKLNKIEGISCVKPKGALYMFVKMDREKFNIQDDEKMVLDLLVQEKVLLIHGKGFNWPTADHFRLVFLQSPEELNETMSRIAHFFEKYRQDV
ncbi:MAG: pyridoxal phosphate-dependent aminotransferase [Saccharospirillaceae bacterium]|nr:pyridoxal phosphate-dependent aminotransferase [Pseudomonadales bacterium]NRB78224.1 pyridoxal phosphate-dependent aminotransferase [Saccharospirillaceae bacterium]